jgi:hypothetical protein
MPWEDEAESCSTAVEGRTEQGEPLQRPQRPLERRFRVARKGCARDHPVEVFDRGLAQLDLDHGSEVVERSRLP